MSLVTKSKPLCPIHLTFEASVRDADVVIGAVLIPGAKAPKLVTDDMVKQMRPGSVIVDVAVDQGGVIETADRVTTHTEPVYEKHGVLHYAVANIPGAVARTSTIALTNVTLPYVESLADNGFHKAIALDEAYAKVSLLTKAISQANLLLLV